MFDADGESMLAIGIGPTGRFSGTACDASRTTAGRQEEDVREARSYRGHFASAGFLRIVPRRRDPDAHHETWTIPFDNVRVCISAAYAEH
jgi:hypothetical protein